MKPTLRRDRMKETKVTVNNKVGLHARPASLFVQEATKYESEIKVTVRIRTQRKFAK